MRFRTIKKDLQVLVNKVSLFFRSLNSNKNKVTFSVFSASLDNISIDSNSSVTAEIPVDYPEGVHHAGVLIRGYSIANASQSGERSANCTVDTIFPSDVGVFKVRIRNLAESLTAKVKITLYFSGAKIE